MHVTGRTKVYGLIGDPVIHARTPEVYNAEFVKRGIDITVVPIHIQAAELAAFIPAARSWQNLVGFGVTMPHKEPMVDLVDELTETAELCGTVNVVRRDSHGGLIGAQLDGPGFLWGLITMGFDPQGCTALLVGAGGTARAIAFSLASHGAKRIFLTNRTLSRAHNLAKEITRSFERCEVVVIAVPPAEDYDLIVNATSLGMEDGDALPVPMKLLGSGMTVADVVVNRPRTELLTAAETRGCRIHSGMSMLTAQIDATINFLNLQ